MNQSVEIEMQAIIKDFSANITTKVLLFFLTLFIAPNISSKTTIFSNTKSSVIYISDSEKPVVKTALEILQQDVKNVFGTALQKVDNLSNFQKSNSVGIIAGTIGQNAEFEQFIKDSPVKIYSIEGKWETFQIQFIRHKLVVIGSDARGTAYGLLQLSRLIGVSPWEWWADAVPEKKTAFSLPENYSDRQSPAVQYRGIFLNDEDWGLNPWSSKNFEPNAKTDYPITGRFKGEIGPETYSKIFELLLRLRANSIWPAMHEVTMPFYFVKGNREAAEKYGIVVGTSHCEPMMRNSATEWELTNNGPYNYFTNKDSVVSYWTDRAKELNQSENIFTLGMRGKHDGRMEGAKTAEQYKSILKDVINDQTEILKQYINKNVSEIPQQFVPYKEVLSVYNSGLEIPDYVTLVWPDDNYGYLRHFPTKKEQQRSGGNGIYYHTSYWGAPHDNIWLGMMSPALMIQQLELAYEKKARKIWILNVGDIKPSEYLTELFLDLAWNGPLVSPQKGKTWENFHLKNWLQREFSTKIGENLLPLLEKHYWLGHIRRPEFMGNTRVYDNRGKEVSDLPYSKQEIIARLTDYQKLADQTEDISKQIPSNKKNEFFELVKYPVQAAAQMNFKMLHAQLARHKEESWSISDAAYDSIVSLTKIYNSLNKGKWYKMMDFQPRKLIVFDRVKRDTINTPLLETHYSIVQPENNSKIQIRKGLGCSGKAFLLPKNEKVIYNIENDKASTLIEIRLLPTHAVEDNLLRISVSIDGGEPQTTNYETKESSEEWKQNILRNYAMRHYEIPSKRGSHAHRIEIKALDEGVYIDEVVIIKQ